MKGVLALVGLLALGTTAAVAQDELDQGITELATQIAASSRSEGKHRIAIIDFADLDGSVSAFGQHLAEALVTELFQVAPDKFEVVERRYLSLVLREQKLTMNELFDPQSLAQVGQFLGVDEIATGTISDIGDMVELNTRFISAQSGMITAAAKVRLRKLGTIEILMSQRPAIRNVADDSPAQAGGAAAQSEVQVLGRAISSTGVVFEVVRASLVGNKVRIDLKITSSENNVTCSLTNDSRIIDAEGNEYRTVNISLGKENSVYKVTANPLVKGIATKASLEFAEISSPSLTNIALLELSGSAGVEGKQGWNEWTVRIRDIPVK